MYTVCYVLTDNPKLLFYHQLLISIRSLRKYSATQPITVLMDKTTELILTKQNRTELNSDESIKMLTVEIPDYYNQKEKSRYLKLKTRKLLTGTFLFVDTDTVFSDKLPEILSDSQLALTYDLNIKIKDRIDRKQLEDMNRSYGYPISEKKYEYYNSGVIWCQDTDLCHSFYSDWFQCWEVNRSKGQVLDQPSLNYVNRKRNGVISSLQSIYNVQISASPCPIQYLSRAVIIHYFNIIENSPYLLSNYNIFNSHLSDKEINQILENPKSAFAPCILLRRNSETDHILHSYNYQALTILYRKFPRLFQFINKILSHIIG